jgi:hypothetical protein
MVNAGCVGCHSNAAFPACRRFVAPNVDASSAYNFAVANSIAGDPAGSLFLRKNSGGCPNPGCLSCTGVLVAGHSGGAPWLAGSAGNIAVTNWINGGRLPEPVEVPVLSGAAFDLIRTLASGHAPRITNLRRRN